VNNIIQFHIDHNYYVNVKSLPKMAGCCVEFPANHFEKRPKNTVTYLIETNPFRIEIYEVEDGTNLNVRKVDATQSSARVLVLEDILLRTLSRKLAQCLIIVDGTEGKNVFDALSFTMGTRELELEKELLYKFRELILGKVDNEVEDPELAEGYRLVLNCFENGGL